MGSTTDKFPKLPSNPDEESEVRSHMYYLTFNRTADAYYVSVFGYDTSYYTITPVVTRINDKYETIVTELDLVENIPSINYIEEGEKVLRFYISHFVGSSLYVDLEQIEGYMWFEIDEADDKWETLANSNWKSHDGWVEVTQKDPVKPTNYIVSVRSDEGVFSIQYTKKGGCVMYRFAKPIHIRLGEDVTRCYSYEINNVDDIEITTSVGNYDGGINNLNLTVEINGTSIQLNESVELIPATKWLEYCPNLFKSERTNKTTCFMNIYASSYLPLVFTLVAQYKNEEILLLDGVYQRVQANLNRDTPRHYYFVAAWETTITVFLKSFTDTNYTIIGRLTTWR